MLHETAPHTCVQQHTTRDTAAAGMHDVVDRQAARLQLSHDGLVAYSVHLDVVVGMLARLFGRSMRVVYKTNKRAADAGPGGWGARDPQLLSLDMIAEAIAGRHGVGLLNVTQVLGGYEGVSVDGVHYGAISKEKKRRKGTLTTSSIITQGLMNQLCKPPD